METEDGNCLCLYRIVCCLEQDPVCECECFGFTISDPVCFFVSIIPSQNWSKIDFFWLIFCLVWFIFTLHAIKEPKSKKKSLPEYSECSAENVLVKKKKFRPRT